MSHDPERDRIQDEATKSLERMQKFDPQTLPRTDVLGSVLSFADAVDPAIRLIELYRQLPLEVLEQLPKSYLNQIKDQANNDFNIVDAILKFEPGMPRQDRDNRVTSLRNAYDPTFQRLHPFISYSVRKSTDFSRLEREARSLIQNVSDRADELQGQLEKRKKEADSVLEAVRKVAEEQGVSQQAIYFKTEADNHDKESKSWLKTTVALTVVLALYAIATLFLHKIPFLAPANAYETTQLAVSKVLVFVTISFQGYALFSSAYYLLRLEPFPPIRERVKTGSSATACSTNR